MAATTGEFVRLTARDGFTLNAWRAAPAGTPRGGVVVLQEIFGLNAHIRSVADRFAAEGYLAIARHSSTACGRGSKLGYTPEDVTQGAGIRAQTTLDGALADVHAAMCEATAGGKVGVVGYCWGGTLAYAASARLEGVAAAVCYYGGGIAGMLGETPRAPTIMHFGARDKHIRSPTWRRSSRPIRTSPFSSTRPTTASTATPAPLRRALGRPRAGAHAGVSRRKIALRPDLSAPAAGRAPTASRSPRGTGPRRRGTSPDSCR